MIAIAAMTQLAPVPAPPVDPDVVVIARRMRSIEVDLKTSRRDGVLTLDRCRISKSSHDAELDGVACDAARLCVADGMSSRAMLERCVLDRSQPMLEAIVARRRAQEGRS